MSRITATDQRPEKTGPADEAPGGNCTTCPRPSPSLSRQRRVATLTTPPSPGRVPTPHATWLGTHDARMEQPYTREFAFCPLTRVLAQRMELVVAALTLIRAWITAGRPRHGQGRAGSFEAWDDLVRQVVCWIATWDDPPVSG